MECQKRKQSIKILLLVPFGKENESNVGGKKQEKCAYDSLLVFILRVDLNLEVYITQIFL